MDCTGAVGHRSAGYPARGRKKRGKRVKQEDRANQAGFAIDVYKGEEGPGGVEGGGPIFGFSYGGQQCVYAV